MSVEQQVATVGEVSRAGRGGWMLSPQTLDHGQYFALSFDKLILRKIIKIVATRCHILKLKCTKFDFGWGSAPDPARGVYSAPQTP